MTELTPERVEKLHGRGILDRASAIVAQKKISLGQAVSEALQEHRRAWLAESVALMNIPILSASERDHLARE